MQEASPGVPSLGEEGRGSEGAGVAGPLRRFSLREEPGVEQVRQIVAAGDLREDGQAQDLFHGLDDGAMRVGDGARVVGLDAGADGGAGE